MPEPIISVENLGKRYRLHHAKQERYTTLRDTLARKAKALFKPSTLGSELSTSDEDFWALKDLNFEIQQGEVVGIIGRNGAGKSTLLKILSRITEPTEGRITLRGRVASLLEVGTGFHPELSGRENIFLNGAILGMNKAEIRSKFDEIVAFAEVERFLDTPVKHYSSGMYVRLAFAVAAHLEPEILVVDEVLAVGDAEFQKKCLGKMSQVSSQGRTVLFVSHQMGVVANLCQKAVLLKAGRVEQVGVTSDIIATYLAQHTEDTGQLVWEEDKRPGNERAKMLSLRLVQGGQPTANPVMSKPLVIELEYEHYMQGGDLGVSFHLNDGLGSCILATGNQPSANARQDNFNMTDHARGRFRSVCELPGNFLNEGGYSISAFLVLSHSQLIAMSERVLNFRTHDDGAMRKEFTGPWIGQIRPRLAWTTQAL